jgi:hypothetical protein
MAFQGVQVLKRSDLRLMFGIRLGVKGMKGVEFSNLDRLKEEGLLRSERFIVHTFDLVRR